MPKNAQFILEGLNVQSVASKGKAIARDAEGRVVFIKGAVPGDVVKVQVQKKRKQHLEGTLIELTQASPLRVPAQCQHFGLCGGCSWQNLLYSEQLKAKQNEVINHLERLGGLELPECEPILPAPEIYRYRNKLEYSFSGERWLEAHEVANTAENFDRRAAGFHIPGRWDRVFNVNTCHLQPEPSNLIRDFIKQYAIKQNWSFYHPRQKQGFLRSLMLRNNSRGDFMVMLQVAENRSRELHELLSALQEAFSEIKSIWYAFNDKANDSLYELDMQHFWGQALITETMPGFRGAADLHFNIGPKSFYQTNPKQAAELYRIALEFANLQNEALVYDLYTGTGTLALYMAQKAKQVIGIEGVEAAVADARLNAELNGISNAQFFAGDMRKVLDAQFIRTHGKPQMLLTDPPREGMHPDVVKQIIEIAPPKWVYISCNSATQARDLGLMKEHYEIEKLQPVDMFPHTAHIENVVLLKQRNL